MENNLLLYLAIFTFLILIICFFYIKFFYKNDQLNKNKSDNKKSDTDDIYPMW